MVENRSVAFMQEHMKILVVEDNPVDVELLKYYINQAFPDCIHHVAGSLAEAMQMLEAEPYHFIILDLNLPDSNGLLTLRSIVHLNQEVPILIYSSIEDSDLALEALKLGAQDYLIKGKGDHYTLKRVIQYSIERQQYHRQLRQSEQMLRMFIRHPPAAIAVFDRDYKMLIVSDRWRVQHGISEQDVERGRATKLLHCSSNRWYTMFQRCLSGEFIRCEEDVFMTPAGTEEYIKWEMMPWFDENGQVGGVVQFTEFITQARMMRLALEEAKENLELKVQERTRDLEAAVRETEAAQTAKDEFFANITHELRTPLHAIINFSKFGLNKTVNEDGTPGDLQKITGYFADINRSGNRLLLLVDDLLDLTKNKVKAAKLSIKQHSMLELYDEVCSEMSSILEAKNMVMQTAFAVTQPIITCDRQRIHQVLLNLISNAVKFSEPGSAITLILEEGEHYRLKKGLESYIVIAVEDRGIGIPENELESIFDEFKQSSKVMSGKFSKGTGLGLAICRQIIHAHNGFIWAENNPQGGTRLCFALPREFGNVETKKPATKKKGSKAA